MAPREKLRIRLPNDPGPNPWDSKTPLKQLAPRWYWDWKWWVGVLTFAIGVVAVRYWNHTL